MKKASAWILMCMICGLLFAGCTNEIENIIESEQESVETEVESFSLNRAEKTVVIPEVNRAYTIWFFSDSHIIIPDEEASEQVQAYTAERQPVFVNEMGVDSSQIFTEFIELANEQQPDMVLFGGDILDFPSEANIAFLKEELSKLTIPYIYTMGNHDWTFPWEYMTPEGTAQYRPLYDGIMYGNLNQEEDKIETVDAGLNVESVSGNSYATMVELDDLVILAVDDSSNQTAAEAVEYIELAYETDKPIVLMQHVPFSSEKLIAEAKNYWANPVTLGMQVHGGLAPNDVSADLYGEVLDDESDIRLVLAGHVHFPYEEQISGQTVEIIADAAYKGEFVQVNITSLAD